MEFNAIFDNIVKQINKEKVRALSTSTSRQIVMINRKRKTILQRAPMLPLGSDIVYILVTNSNDLSAVVKNAINSHMLHDFAADQKLGLKIEYHASCPPGNEQQVALALFDPETDAPGKVFEACVIKCINRLWEEEFLPVEQQNGSALETFCKTGEQNLELMRARLEREMAGQTGLKLQFRLTLPSRSNLEPIQIDDVLELRFMNSEDTFSAKCRANISVAPSQGLLALLYPPVQHELETKVKKKLLDFMREEVKLEQLVYELDTSVRPRVRQALNSLFAPCGRQIESLTIQLVDDLRMPQGITMKYDVETNVIGHDHILIKNDLEVEPNRSKLVDFWRTGVSNHIDLVNKLQHSLDTVVRKSMFGKKYLDVLLRFNGIQSEIETLMQTEADNLGYHIKLITSTPDLEPLVWKTRGFTLETNDGSVEFATRMDHIKVKVNVIVKGKLSDLNRVEDYLVAKEDVREIIRTRIVEYLAIKLHEITPREYYSNFDFAMDRPVALKVEFQEEIAALLSREFGVSDISVIVKSLQTVVLDRITKLQRTPGVLSIKVTSLQDMRVEIPLKIGFDVLRVVPERWDVFHVRDCAIQEIQEFLEKALMSDLKLLLTQHTAWDDLEGREMLKALLNRRAQEFAADQFGLLIKLSIIDRDPTLEETLWSEAINTDIRYKAAQVGADMANAREIESIKAHRKLRSIVEIEEQLAETRKLITSLSSSPGDEDEIDELRTRAKELEAEIDARNAALSTDFVPEQRNLDSLAPAYKKDRKQATTNPLMGLLNAAPEDLSSSAGDAPNASDRE